MTKRSDGQIIAMSEDARRVLDSEAFQTAMKAMRDQTVEQWKACPVRDREGQLLLLQLAKLTDRFEGELRQMIEAGKMAQARIDIAELRDESAPRRFMRRVVNG